ncbi:hypothetical protein DB347_07415 [Opitutaceae bacterium EW11]|nr:hypothetical protein DB347_07415 [Opitutaceae bacterium EW11]
MLGLGAPELLLLMVIPAMLLFLGAIPAILAAVVLSRIPRPHRKQEPGLAFLLLIPFFSLIWAFFVHPRVAESLRSYYASSGDQSVGDCGAGLALWLCICPILAFIPLLGLFAGIAGLVLMIVFYIKAFELSGRIPKAVQ